MAISAYKFGILFGSTLFQGQAAYDRLYQPLWRPCDGPGQNTWEDNIPVLVPLPNKRLHFPNVFKPYPANIPPFRTALYQVQFGADKKQTWFPCEIEADLEMWDRRGITGWRETDHAKINVDNPAYPIAVAARQKQKDDYLIALRSEYAGGHFVLMGFDKVWKVMDNQESPKWLGFINRTVLWSKAAAIKNMLKL